MKNTVFKILKYAFITFLTLILLFAGYVGLNLWSMKPKIYKNPKDYQMMKARMVEQDKIKHFPDEIPADATEIQFFAYTQMPYDGELLLLNFKTNKKFIENELKKNEFWNKNDKLGQKQSIYFTTNLLENFNEQDYTYYAIQGNYTNERLKELFPGRTWLGIDIKHNKIIYYHRYPAD